MDATGYNYPMYVNTVPLESRSLPDRVGLMVEKSHLQDWIREMPDSQGIQTDPYGDERIENM